MNDLKKAKWELQLMEQMETSADFRSSTFSAGDHQMTLYYLKSLVDLNETVGMMKSLLGQSTQAAPSSVDLAGCLLEGKAIVSLNGLDAPLIITPVELVLNRPIMSPQTVQPLQGAFDSFTENLDANIGLLRKKLKRKDFAAEAYTTGTNTHREIALVYLKGAVHKNVVDFMKQKLAKNRAADVHNVSDLLKLLEQPRISLVPSYLSSELSEETAQNMLAGKVIVLIDQFPFALAFPAIIKDLWSLRSDLNNPVLFRLFYRFIRIAGILFSIVTPSLYVILNAVNPELLRIQLALSVAESREGVPYPSIVEVCLMLLLFELVIEATIRLPKGIGPTLTMIGGIILGQAIVQAHLVSNLLIIILAASSIANFTITGYINTIGIRIFKYGALFLSAIFGIFGLEAALLWFCVYLAGLKPLSVSYLSLHLKGNSAYD
ncbi:spore germination protein [Cohnella endophytica]|uniref:spore germination protein n=1 Tax=Cohnella endophytica TaxID=2419778 RepID=UPI0013142BBD|nr:spore germination protein [Cohnella endophytica]